MEFSPLKMCLCTYIARITGMDMEPRRLIETVQPSGDVKAINCNFGHKTQEGFEIYLKKEKTLPDPARGGAMPSGRRQRKKQGDGSCFNNCIEAVIIPEPALDRTKVAKVIKRQRKLIEKAYYLKYFSATGEIQVPGIILPTLEDGHKVIRLWIDFLNNTKGLSSPISLVRQGSPIMLNFKFFIVGIHPSRGFLDFDVFAKLLKTTPDPPYTVREVNNNFELLKLSVKFVVPMMNDKIRKVRVVIFPRGKVDILGATSFDAAERIYTYLSAILKKNGDKLVYLTPIPDNRLTEDELYYLLGKRRRKKRETSSN